MEYDKLKTILEYHLLWLQFKPGGVEANLRGANLRGANLRGANLREAKRDSHILINAPILLCGGFGSRNATTMAFCIAQSEGGLLIECGCWSGVIGEFRKRIAKTHGNSPIAKEYLLMCDLLEMRRARLFGQGEDE